MNIEKYPRTYHFPFSPGKGSDDKVLLDWKEHLDGKYLVFTEKLDGGNTQINPRGVFARSVSGPTSHPSFDYLKSKWASIRADLENNRMTIFGENLYAIHSIEYTNLDSYFYVFAAKVDDKWLSWEDVKALASLYDWPTVPELPADAHIEKAINHFMKEESSLGGPREGIVVRNADSFSEDQFKYNVLKYVRANHVQTDQHWTVNWKKAKLKSI